jgi:hypothetical protein
MDVAGEKSGIKHAYNLIMNICKKFIREYANANIGVGYLFCTNHRYYAFLFSA